MAATDDSLKFFVLHFDLSYIRRTVGATDSKLCMCIVLVTPTNFDFTTKTVTSSARLVEVIERSNTKFNVNMVFTVAEICNLGFGGYWL